MKTFPAVSFLGVLRVCGEGVPVRKSLKTYVAALKGEYFYYITIQILGKVAFFNILSQNV